MGDRKIRDGQHPLFFCSPDRTMIDTGVEELKYVRGALTRVKETARLALAVPQHILRRQAERRAGSRRAGRRHRNRSLRRRKRLVARRENDRPRESKRLPLRTPACFRARRSTSVLPDSLHAGEFLHRLQIFCLLFNTSPADGTIISDAS